MGREGSYVVVKIGQKKISGSSRWIDYIFYLKLRYAATQTLHA